MIKKLTQRFFAAAAAFVPMAAFAHGTGEGHMMNGVMWGHDKFGLIMAPLLIAFSGGIVYLAIKFLYSQEKPSSPMPE